MRYSTGVYVRLTVIQYCGQERTPRHPAEFLVFGSQTGYMSTCSGFINLNWGIIYKLLQNYR